MKAAIFGVLILLFGGPAVAQTMNPALTTEWKTSDLSQEVCKARAEKSIRAAGLTDKVHVLNWSVVGQGKGYSVGVRCMPDQKVVFFTAAGPQLAQADKFLDQVIAHFQAAK